MSNFIVSEYFKTIPKAFNIGDVEFELKGLTNALIEDIKNCDSYDKMVKAAADYGLSCDNKRVMEDEEKCSHVENMWKDVAKKLGHEINAILLVGEYVCDISGISDILIEQLDRETAEAKKIKDEVEAHKMNADNIVKQQLNDNPNIDIQEFAADNAADVALNL